MARISRFVSSIHRFIRQPACHRPLHPCPSLPFSYGFVEPVSGPVGLLGKRVPIPRPYCIIIYSNMAQRFWQSWPNLVSHAFFAADGATLSVGASPLENSAKGYVKGGHFVMKKTRIKPSRVDRTGARRNGGNSGGTAAGRAYRFTGSAEPRQRKTSDPNSYLDYRWEAESLNHQHHRQSRLRLVEIDIDDDES